MYQSFHVDVAVGQRPDVHRRLGHLVVAPRRVAEHVAHRQERKDLPVLGEVSIGVAEPKTQVPYVSEGLWRGFVFS